MRVDTNAVLVVRGETITAFPGRLVILLLERMLIELSAVVSEHSAIVTKSRVGLAIFLLGCMFIGGLATSPLARVPTEFSVVSDIEATDDVSTTSKE